MSDYLDNLDTLLEEDYDTLKAKVGEPDRPEDYPWCGPAWILLALVCSLAIVGFMAYVVIWIGELAGVILRALWGML